MRIKIRTAPRVVLLFLSTLVLFPLAFGLSVLSQESGSIYAPSGIGVLSIAAGDNQSEVLNFSQDTLVVYDSPEGKSLGLVYPGSGYYYLAFSFDTASFNTAVTKSISMDPSDAIAINYEGTCLRLFDTSKGYVEILRHTLDGKSQCWAKVSDLEEMGLEPMPWVEFFLSLNRFRTFYNTSAEGLELRSAPSEDSSLVMTLSNSGLRIMLTGERSGYWLGAKISDKYLEMGMDSSTVNWKRGWVQPVDNSGKTRFWYYPKGC